MPRIIKIGIFVFLLVVLMSSSVRASEYFHDDFSSDLSKWDMSIGDTSWTIQNNQLVGQVRRGESSYIYAKNTFSLSDFIFTALVRNEGGIDQHFLFRVSPDKSSFYIIELRYGDEYWPQDGNSIRIWRFKNGSYTLLMPDVPYSMVQDITHFLKIVFIGHNIKVEIDNNLLVNIDDNSNSALLSGGFGLQNYAGDYWFRPVKNIFDDIDISGESVGGLHKIIIIPGLGGSWNTRAMVYGETVGDDRWQMTPFATNYDNLISALEDKGKVRDQDFFVWNYDWRPQVATIVSKLDNFIEQKVESNEKVDLVGHSLGGLVARIWGEENSSDSRLGKVISLGSPHQGAVKAYDAWAGADIADKPDMASIALNVLLTLQMKNYGSRVNTVRGFVPSIRDLLPVFDFTKKNGTALGFESMTTVNNYLVSKNLGAAAVFGDLRAMVGSGFNTKRWINLGENSVFDKVLGRWPDGKPINYLTDDGDGTVLISSGRFDGDAYDQFSADHGTLVDKAIPKIFEELGLGIAVEGSGNYDLSGKLVFYIGSPASLSVSCDGGPVLSSDTLGFLLVDSNNVSSCLLSVVGSSSGTYHLVIGRADDQNSFQYFENEIDWEETQQYVLNLKSDDLGINTDLYGLIIRDLNLLLAIYPRNKNLLTALAAAASKSDQKMVDGLFAFRREKQEMSISERVINNLELVLTNNCLGIESNKANLLLTRMEREKLWVDVNSERYRRRRTSPSGFGSASYAKIENLITRARDDLAKGRYCGVAGKGALNSKLIYEVW